MDGGAECWRRHRVKNPENVLVPFPFNEPVVYRATYATSAVTTPQSFYGTARTHGCQLSSSGPSARRAVAAPVPADLRLGRITEVFLARWELFGEDSFREKLFGFLFREGGKDHHTVSLLPVNWSGNWI